MLPTPAPSFELLQVPAIACCAVEMPNAVLLEGALPPPLGCEGELEAVEEAYRQIRISGDGADRARALCEDYGDTWANRREGRSGVALE